MQLDCVHPGSWKDSSLGRSHGSDCHGKSEIKKFKKVRLSYYIYIIVFFIFGNGAIVQGQIKIDSLYLRQQVEVILPDNTARINETDIYIKNGNVRIESKQGSFASLVTLYSGKEKSTTLLSNIMGQKEKKTIKPALSDRTTSILYVEESKQIAGLDCKKAILKISKGGIEEESVVWYSVGYSLTFSYNFGVQGLERVKGIPIEYENVLNGIKMRHRVVELNLTRPMDASLFIVPSDYATK